MTPEQIAAACIEALHAAEVMDVPVVVRTTGDAPDDWAIDLGDFGVSIMPRTETAQRVAGFTVCAYRLHPVSGEGTWDDARIGLGEPQDVEEVGHRFHACAGNAMQDAVLRVMAQWEEERCATR